VEDWNWDTIFYGHYRSIFNYCEIIGLQSYGIRWKRRKIRAITPLKVIQGHRGRCQILSPLHSAQNLLQNDRYKSHHTLKTLLHYPVKPSPDGQTDGRTDRILIARPRLHSMQRGLLWFKMSTMSQYPVSRSVCVTIHNKKKEKKHINILYSCNYVIKRL